MHFLLTSGLQSSVVVNPDRTAHYLDVHSRVRFIQVCFIHTPIEAVRLALVDVPPGPQFSFTDPASLRSRFIRSSSSDVTDFANGLTIFSTSAHCTSPASSSCGSKIDRVYDVHLFEVPGEVQNPVANVSVYRVI